MTNAQTCASNTDSGDDMRDDFVVEHERMRVFVRDDADGCITALKEAIATGWWRNETCEAALRRLLNDETEVEWTGAFGEMYYSEKDKSLTVMVDEVPVAISASDVVNSTFAVKLFESLSILEPRSRSETPLLYYIVELLFEQHTNGAANLMPLWMVMNGMARSFDTRRTGEYCQPNPVRLIIDVEDRGEPRIGFAHVRIQGQREVSSVEWFPFDEIKGVNTTLATHANAMLQVALSQPLGLGDAEHTSRPTLGALTAALTAYGRYDTPVDSYVEKRLLFIAKNNFPNVVGLSSVAYDADGYEICLTVQSTSKLKAKLSMVIPYKLINSY